MPPVLLATALYLVPLRAAHWCADHAGGSGRLGRGSRPVAWLRARGRSAGRDWNAEASWLLAVCWPLPCVLCAARAAAACRAPGERWLLLCGGFLLREPTPGPGELWL